MHSWTTAPRDADVDTHTLTHLAGQIPWHRPDRPSLFICNYFMSTQRSIFYNKENHSVVKHKLHLQQSPGFQADILSNKATISDFYRTNL